MSRNELPSNAYTFRTTHDDDYLERVMEEADPKANFLLVTDDDKFTGERGMFTLVRKEVTALSYIFPHLKLGDLSLGEYMDHALEMPKNQPFVALYTSGPREEIDRLNETTEHDIRHINNIMTGRTTQVTVQSF